MSYLIGAETQAEVVRQLEPNKFLAITDKPDWVGPNALQLYFMKGTKRFKYYAIHNPKNARCKHEHYEFADTEVLFAFVR